MKLFRCRSSLCRNKETRTRAPDYFFTVSSGSSHCVPSSAAHRSEWGRKKPIELLFNLEHPDEFVVVTEAHEDGDDEDEDWEDRVDDKADSTEDELRKRFDRMTFGVPTQ